MKSTFEKMGGTYTLGADGIYYPNLVSTDEEPHYGKYGMMRKTYLKEHRPAMYSLYMLEDRLTEHLNTVDDEAQERMDILVRQMMDRQGITEELKARDQMVWVGAVNNIRNAAEERNHAFAQFLQVQLVRHRQLGNGRQIERGKAHTYTYQNRFRRFACRLFENAVLLTSDAVGFTHFQSLKKDVQRGLVVVIVLVDFGGGNHLHDHREVLFFGRGLVQQVQHKGLQQGGFGL